MGSPTTRATPLLTAFRTRARPRGESIAHADGSAFQTFLTLMGCLLPVSVCWYQAVAEPLFAVGSVEFTHPDLVASLIVLAAGGRAVVKGFGRVPRSIVITSSLFLLSTALSALVAKDTLRGFAAVLQDLEFLAILWAYSSVIDPKNFLRVIHFTLAVFVFQSLVAAGQFVTGVSMPTGTFFSHQQYAFFISVGACVAFALFASEQVGWKKFLYLITLSILVVGSLLGQERAPWLSFVLSGAVVGAYSGRKRRKVLLMGLAMTVTAAVLLVVGVPQLREVTISRIAEAEVQTESRNSLLSRFLLWGIAFKLFTENPILGIGPKNFVSVVPHYATSEEMMGSEALDPHNAWIEYLAEQGIIGFITYTAFCWALIKLVTKSLRKNLFGLARSLCLAYLAYNVFWLTMLIPYFIKGMGHIHFMIIGLMIGLTRVLDSGFRDSQARVTV